MSEKKVFSTPLEVNFGLPAPLVSAVNFIEQNLKYHKFTFKVPYEVKKFQSELTLMLKDSGWILSAEIGSDEWSVKPQR